MPNWIDVSALADWSQNDLRYMMNSSEFSEFFHRAPDFDSILPQLIEKKVNFSNREFTAKYINDCYSNHSATLLQQQNLDLLYEDDTFTITAAHQPCLFGGPLYFAIKIASCIALCNQLKLKFPKYNFVPIYYCGEEDHDFQEINHLNLFGKKVAWEKESNGPVGRNSLDGLSEVVQQLKQLLEREHYSSEFFAELDERIKTWTSYHDFYFWFINKVFGEFGLLYFSPDSKILKDKFIPFFIDEVENSIVIKETKETIEALEAIKFDIQASPRDINLFYINDKGERTRIIATDSHYTTAAGDVLCKKEEIKNFISNNSVSINGNVMMRPLYQEFLLPNIIFIGGGAEISYWMELKKVFQHYNLTYPILSRRMSAMIIDDKTLQKFETLGYELNDLCKPLQTLKAKFIESNSGVANKLEAKTLQIEKEFEKLGILAKEVNEQVFQSAKSDLVKISKDLQHLSAKIIKNEKLKFEAELTKIEKIKSTVFPNDGLQERYSAWLFYYLRFGDSFIRKIIDSYQFSSKEFAVFKESEFQN